MNSQEQAQFFSFLEQQYLKFRKLHTESENQLLQGISFTGYDNLNVKITTITDDVIFTIQQKWFQNESKIPVISLSLPFKDCKDFLTGIYNDYFYKEYVCVKHFNDHEEIMNAMQYLKSYLYNYSEDSIKVDYESIINIPYKNKNIRLDIGDLYDANLLTNVSLTGMFVIPFVLEHDLPNESGKNSTYLKLPFSGWEAQDYKVLKGFVNIHRASNLKDILKIFKQHLPETANMLNYHMLDNSIQNKDTNKTKYKI